MGETTALAENIVSTSYDDFPAEVIEHSKRAIADYIGVAVYGSHHDVGEKIVAYVEDQTPGTESTIFGHGTASASGAALANGTFGHAIDYDDTFESIVIHPTSPVFAAAFAAIERAGGTGRDLLTAYILGCEVAYRVGHSTYPDHYKNGWHATGTIGSFGATAAVASILELDVETTRRALGITASGSSSLKKNFGSMTKPLHAGNAARIGVQSALLAENGFTADVDIFEGPIGYGEAMTVDGSYDPSELTAPWGDWAVLDIGFKPHPSGVITHAAMDSLRTIVIENELTPDDVETITVTLDDAASEMLIHANPENALQAKFSIEFCLAAILRERKAGIHEFTDDYVNQPETKAVLKKVDRAFEPNLFGSEYAGYGARIIVQNRNGEEFENEIKFAPGSPNNPVSGERLRAKFDECVATVLAEDSIEDLHDVIDELEAEDSPSRLTSVTRLK